MFENLFGEIERKKGKIVRLCTSRISVTSYTLRYSLVRLIDSSFLSLIFNVTNKSIIAFSFSQLLGGSTSSSQ